MIRKTNADDAGNARLSKCEVKNHRGVPAIFINGRPVPGMTFLVREYFDLAYIRQYVKTGHKICIFEIKEQHHLPREMHYKWIDDQLRRLVALSPDLYIILGVYISMGKAWAARNPGELCRYENGSVNKYTDDVLADFPAYHMEGARQGYFSFASKVFEKDSCALMKDYIGFIKTRDYAGRIIGYFPEAGSTHEWNMYSSQPYGSVPDFSAPMTNAFREFLRRRYKNVKNLQKAWGDRRVNFDSAQVPGEKAREKTDNGCFRDPSRDRRVMDYYECVSKEMTDRKEALAKTVKAETNWKSIVGFYHGTTQDGSPGGYGWNQFIRSPYIDFGASPPAYEQRAPGNHSPLHNVIDTYHLHGKIFFSEDDLRPMYPVKDKRANPSVRHYGGLVKDLDESLNGFKKEIMQNIVNGVYGWWYDFHYKWYDRPQYFRLFGKLNGIYGLSFRHDRRKNSDIAIIFDEESHRYFGPNNRVNRNLYHREMIQEMGRLGTTADLLMHDDLDNPALPEYKLYIFLNCFRLTSSQVKMIDRIKKNGHTLLFFYGQGYINDEAKKSISVDNMKRLIGMNFKEVPRDIVAYATMGDSGHPLAKLLPNGFSFGQHFRNQDNEGFPPGIAISPLFTIDDKDADVLGYYCYEHDVHPAIGLKKFANWNSLYVGTIEIPAMFLRAAAKLAGCHLYLDTDDVVYAGKHFLAIYATEGDGPRTISLPRVTEVRDLFKNKLISRGTRKFTVNLKQHETVAYFLGKL